MQSVLNLVWDKLLPALEEGTLPADEAAAGVVVQAPLFAKEVMPRVRAKGLSARQAVPVG